MSKGSYNVENGKSNPPPTTRDASYRSCLCALLIFIALCAIIVLASYKWTKTNEKPKDEFETIGTSDEQQGDRRNEHLEMATIARTTATTTTAGTKRTTAMTTTRANLKTTAFKRTKPHWILMETIEPATTSTTSTTTTAKTIPTAVKTTSTTAKTTPTTAETETTGTTTAKATSAFVRSDDDTNVIRDRSVTLDYATTLVTNETTEESSLTSEDPAASGANSTGSSVDDSIENATEIESINGTTERHKPTVFGNSSNATSSAAFETTAATVSNETLIDGKKSPTTTESIDVTVEAKTSTPIPIQTTRKIVLDAKPPEYVAIESPSPSVCKRPGCETESGRILTAMNHAASPCDNFYEFACGGSLRADGDEADAKWRRSRLIGFLNKVNATDRSHLVKFKTFYASCLEYTDEFDYEARIETIKDILNVTEKSSADGEARDPDLTELFAKLLLAGSLPFFDIDTDIDKLTSKIVLKMRIADETSNVLNVKNWKSFWLGRQRCLEKQRSAIEDKRIVNLNAVHDEYVKCRQNYSAYIASIGRSCDELGHFDDLPHPFNVTQRMEFVKTSVEWDVLQNLQEVMPEENQLHKKLHEMDYYVTRAADLDKHFGLIDWKRFFEIVTGGRTIDGAQFQIYFHKEFTQLFNKLKKIKEDVLKDVLMAIYTNDLYQYMIVRNSYSENRADYCIDLTADLFKDVTARIFSETYVGDDDNEESRFRNVVNGVFDKIRAMFEVSLNAVTWITHDDGHKLQFLAKLKNLRLTFYNRTNRYLQPSFLDDKYETFAVRSGRFQRNLVEVVAKQRRAYYGLSTKEFDDDALFAYYLMPYDREPTSYYASNMIGVPFGLMRPHYDDLPIDYLHAKIGVRLAMAIAKHYDNVGIGYKMTPGETISGAYDETMAMMGSVDGDRLKVSKPMKNRFVDYTASDKFGIAEKIADNAAFNMTVESLYAYNVTEVLPWVSMTYSSDQLHFIGLTQEFCATEPDLLDFMRRVLDLDRLPAMLKVENMVKNSYRFRAIFNCSTIDANPKYQFPYFDVSQPEDYEGDRSS